MPGSKISGTMQPCLDTLRFPHPRKYVPCKPRRIALCKNTAYISLPGLSPSNYDSITQFFYQMLISIFTCPFPSNYASITQSVSLPCLQRSANYASTRQFRYLFCGRSSHPRTTECSQYISLDYTTVTDGHDAARNPATRAPGTQKHTRWVHELA